LARPLKTGIGYFSHDVDMHRNSDLRMLRIDYGSVGPDVFINLLERIYEKCYYIEATDKFLKLFAGDLIVDISIVNKVLNDCINSGLFHKGLYEKYKILTSQSIQKRYLQACERRKAVYYYEEYLLLDLSDVNISSKVVNVYINSINDDINSINDAFITQSKVKQSKEKEKLNETSLSPFSKNGKTTFNDDWFDKHIWNPWLNKDCSREEAKEYFIEACVTHETTRDKAWLAAKGVLNYFRSRNVQEGVIMNFKTFFLESDGAKITLWANAPPN